MALGFKFLRDLDGILVDLLTKERILLVSGEKERVFLQEIDVENGKDPSKALQDQGVDQEVVGDKPTQNSGPKKDRKRGKNVTSEKAGGVASGIGGQ